MKNIENGKAQIGVGLDKNFESRKCMHKRYLVFILTLLIISNSAYSMNRDEDFDDGFPISRSSLSVHQDQKEVVDEGPDKYERAIASLSDRTEDKYEKAIKICGVENYRRYFISIWGLNIYNSVGFNTDYKSLIEVELHHIAGDMMHIARMAKDDDYKFRVYGAMAYESDEKWFEERAKNKTSSQMLAIVRPTMPGIFDIEYFKNNNDMCYAFRTMIEVFKIFDELTKTGKTENYRHLHSDIRSLYNTHCFDTYSVQNYKASDFSVQDYYLSDYFEQYSYFSDKVDELCRENKSFITYRMQRKLDLTKIFNIRNTITFRNAVEKEEREEQWRRDSQVNEQRAIEAERIRVQAIERNKEEWEEYRNSRHFYSMDFYNWRQHFKGL